jgi:mannan endo-1,4-beta-mannosidase
MRYPVEAEDSGCELTSKLLDGIPSNQGHCSVLSEWQKTSLATPGMGGDGFWQFGTKLSSGLTHDDTFTIYHDTDEWTCLVTDHVARIEAASK